jgi:hypothetical protein
VAAGFGPLALELAPSGDGGPEVAKLEFARRYLEKLIQIEVAVPAPRPTVEPRIYQGSAREVAPAPATGMWPLGGLAQFGWTLAVLAALVYAVSWAGVHFDVPLPWSAARGASGASEGKGTELPSPAGSSEVAPAQGTPPADAPGNHIEPRPAAVSPVEAALQEGDSGFLLEAARSRQPTIAFVVLALLVAEAAILVATRRRVDTVLDSEDFAQALSVWHPVIRVWNTTPRAVKRFMIASGSSRCANEHWPKQTGGPSPRRRWWRSQRSRTSTNGWCRTTPGCRRSGAPRRLPRPTQAGSRPRRRASTSGRSAPPNA